MRQVPGAKIDPQAAAELVNLVPAAAGRGQFKSDLR